MLKNPKFSYLRNSQHINFIESLIEILEKHDPDLLYIRAVLDVLKAHYATMKEVFVTAQGSTITSDIEDTDMKRDSLYIGLKNVILAYNRHFNPAKKLAAKELTAHLKKYGKGIPDLEYNAETAVLQDLIEGIDSNTVLTAHTVTLTIDDWFSELKTVNNEFKGLYGLRVETESQKTKLKLIELRDESVTHYRKLAEHFHAASIMHPAPVFELAEDELNELITTYNNLNNKGKGGENTEEDNE